MPTAVLTPFSRSAAQPAGQRLWRKRLLPAGSIDYKGRTLTFDHGYLRQLADAFSNRAYDYVPFQLAGDSNQHTNDVERYAGQVKGMTVEPDGLWVTLSTTERGEQVLKDNPSLGVSARIVEEYDRADRQFFPAAIQHVLGTHDPRIPGLGGWQAIDAANANDVLITVDLSGATFAGEPTEGTGTMPEYTPEQQARMARLFDIPDDQFNALIDGLTAPVLSADDLAMLGGEGESEMSDEELDALITAAQEAEMDETQYADAALSNNTMLALELTNARADQTQYQLDQVQAHLDRERWLAERRSYLDMGIPGHIVDQAQPLLLGAGHVVELSNGQGVDAGMVMRRVLTGVGEMHRALGLEPGVELGTFMDEPTAHNEAVTARADTVSRFRAQTGL